jgi:hypothetical protein
MNEQRRPISGFLGYLADRARLSSGRSLNLHSYMKYKVLRRLAQRTGARCLIEAGTFLGVTAGRCAPVFERVFTIELDATLAERARTHLRRFSNVEVLEGDAMKLLPQVMARTHARDAVVFLDGHYSGGTTARGEVPEPAIAELEVLARHVDRICGVVIDDFRLFGTESGFPSKGELVTAAERAFPSARFDLAVHADQVIIERRHHASD